MVGFAVKAVLECTTSRAYYVNKILKNFNMIGGITLNYPVGGINPAAVDACLQQGGRIVWGPSGHSKFHATLKGGLGNWGHVGMKMYNPPNEEGITIFDEQGKLTYAIKEIVSIIKKYNALFATSHLSPEEIIEITRYCKHEKVKVLMTHLGWTPEYSLELGKEVVKHGGMIELSAVTFGGGFNPKLKIIDCVERIREYGADKIVLSTDSGALRFPKPCEALRIFGENLILQGIPEKDIRKMMSDNPLKLIKK